MAAVRIMLADLPALVEGVLAAIVDADPELDRVAGLDSDVVILCAPPGHLARDAAPLLDGHPRLAVLGLDPISGAAASLRIVRHGTPGTDELRGLLHALGGRG